MNISFKAIQFAHTPLRVFLATSLIAIGASACSNDAHTPNTSITEPTTNIGSGNSEPQERNLEIWPELDNAGLYSADIETKIETLLKDMTLEQKIAQMIQPEIRDVTVEDMRRYGFGSYLNGGGAFPQNNKHATPSDWIKLAEDMYQASIDDSLDGSTIPTMWGTDAVHGHNNVIGATLFPHNIGLGAANNPDLIENIAQATAREVMATGIDWVFAPTVAVVRDDRWGRTYEGYSEDPDIVRDYSSAIVKGLQGPIDGDFLSDRRVISTVKHFLGDGGTDRGIDQGDNLADEQTLFNIHAQGYVAGLNAGAQTVMASFNSWQGEKIHGHKYLLTDVLKNKMKFDGLVVGDWLGHGQIPGCTNYNCSATINAGLDIFMASGDAWKPLMENTIAQVKSNTIPLSRIDDAVSRILRVKLRAGLFEKPSPAHRPLSGKTDIIGSDEHRAIARQAVRESLVLLKNNNNVLPINPSSRILLAGDAAHNIGKQSGGWTITWQGTGNTNADFPGGTSIYDGFREAVNNANGSITLSEDGRFTERPDVAIVVFGEEPYAEGVGDVKHLGYQSDTKSDLAILTKLASQGIPVVSVFISGRPMYVNSEMNASDAFVAAWLPGSEGHGLSDVLLAKPNGSISFDFTGKLPYSWPSASTQSIVNRHDENYAPLLPYGFGLRYKDESSLSNTLDEETITLKDPLSTTITVFSGSIKAPYSATLSTESQSMSMNSNVAEVNGLKVRTIDRVVQEDARQINFGDNSGGQFSIKSDSPISLSSLKDKDYSLTLLIRPESPVNSDVTLSMACGESCSGSVDIKDALTKLELNEWAEIAVSLKCFEQAGVSLSTVYSPFQLSSKSKLDLSLSDVFVKHTENTIECN